MLPQEWLLVSLLMGSATALAPMPHHSMEESLRSALDAITRKQRSLDTNSQDYYNDLRSFKYHGGEGERKLDRERQGEREIEEEDEEIEFLPNGTLSYDGLARSCIRFMHNHHDDLAYFVIHFHTPPTFISAIPFYKERFNWSSPKKKIKLFLLKFRDRRFIVYVHVSDRIKMQMYSFYVLFICIHKPSTCYVLLFTLELAKCMYNIFRKDLKEKSFIMFVLLIFFFNLQFPVQTYSFWNTLYTVADKIYLEGSIKS